MNVLGEFSPLRRMGHTVRRGGGGSGALSCLVTAYLSDDDGRIVSLSPTDPKKSQCIDQCIQIHQICVNKHRCDINIKFEVSLHF